MEIIVVRPSDETAKNNIRNVSSRFSLKSIFYPFIIAQGICATQIGMNRLTVIHGSP